MLKKNFLNTLYIFFLGAISSYSLPPYNYFVINFFTFSLFFIFLFTQKKTKSNNKSFFKYGWFFGFGYFLCSLYWIAISLTFDESFKFLHPDNTVVCQVRTSRTSLKVEVEEGEEAGAEGEEATEEAAE